MQRIPRDCAVLTADLIWIDSSAPQKNRALRFQKDNRVLLHELASADPTLHLPGMLLPGFVDCHVHLGLLSSTLPCALKALCKAGISAVRDAGDRDNRALSHAATPVESLPLVLPAGRAITFPGGYGDFLGETAKNLQDGVECIARLAEEGARVIKLVVTGLVDFRRKGRVAGPYIISREIKALTRAAHSRGLMVMAHANTDQGVREALAGDVDSIEHGYFMEKDTLKVMAVKGTAWVPTLSPLWQLYRQEPDLGTKLRILGVLVGQQRTLGTAMELGVMVGVGTDLGASGLLPERAYRQELLLYRKAGLGWEEVLRAASFNGYRILGVENLSGPDMAADMLIHLPRDLEGCFRAEVPGPVNFRP